MKTGISRMMAGIVFLAFAVATGCAMGQVEAPDNRVAVVGSGRLVDLEYTVSDFDSVSVGLTYIATIRQGETAGVTVSIDDNLAEYAHVEVIDRCLYIGLDPAFAYDLPAATMAAELSMPALRRLEATSSSGIQLVDFNSAGPVDVELSSAAFLAGRLVAPSLTMRLSGAAVAILSGSVDTLVVEATGVSRVDLSGLLVTSGSSIGGEPVGVAVAGRLDEHDD